MTHEIARPWRLKEFKYRLVGEICPHCEAKIMPPRDICPECRCDAKTKFQFSGIGEIYSLTKVIDAPAGFENQAPYYEALIKLIEGPLLVAQLTDLDRDDNNCQIEPLIGQTVEMVTRVIQDNGPKGVKDYGYKFRPVLERK